MQLATLCPYLAASLVAILLFHGFRRRMTRRSLSMDVIVIATVFTGLAFGIFRHA